MIVENPANSRLQPQFHHADSNHTDDGDGERDVSAVVSEENEAIRNYIEPLQTAMSCRTRVSFL
jgi:hypothetical protein